MIDVQVHTMSKTDAAKRDISWWLATNKTIEKINFSIKGRYKVWPKMYQSDVSYAIKGDRILVEISDSYFQIEASYFPGFLIFGDKLTVPCNFDISDYRQQATIIHECTHAHIDMRSIGEHSGHEDEAVAYIAEATFLVALNKQPLDKTSIRKLAYAIGKKVVGGTYFVPDIDADGLIQAVARHPQYRKKKTYKSDGVWSPQSLFNPCK